LTTLEAAEIVLREIEERSRQRFLPIVGPVKGQILEDLVREHRPQRILEVGALVGYSAILMARHLPSGGRIWTLEADPRASMRRLAADWEGEETLTQAIARAYNAPEEEVSVDTKTGDVWVGGGPGWLGDESLAELPAQLSAIGYHVGCGEDPEDHEWVATVEVDGGIEHCAVCGLRRRRVWPGSQRNPGEATEEVEYDAPTPEEG